MDVVLSVTFHGFLFWDFVLRLPSSMRPPVIGLRHPLQHDVVPTDVANDLHKKVVLREAVEGRTVSRKFGGTFNL